MLLDGTLREVAGLQKVQDGALRRVTSLYKMKDGQLRMAASFSPVAGATPMTATISPQDVYGRGNRRNVQSVLTAPATVTPSGGSAPYSYAWTASPASVTQQGMATTSFSLSLYDDEVTYPTSCTVTDAAGNQASVSGTATFSQSPRTNETLE